MADAIDVVRSALEDEGLSEIGANARNPRPRGRESESRPRGRGLGARMLKLPSAAAVRALGMRAGSK
jgi:hypothetical protein